MLDCLAVLIVLGFAGLFVWYYFIRKSLDAIRKP